MLLQLSEKTFLKILLALIFSPMLFVALFNWFVDPYTFFHPPVIKGFNDQPILADASRIHKPCDVTKKNYDALIMGTSRGNALKPHESWQGFNVFNASMPAGTVYEMYRCVQHAHAHYPLKRLVIGLGLTCFSATRKHRSQFNENRLLVTEKFERVNPLLRRKVLFRDVSGLLVSKEVIELSFEKMLTSFRHRHDQGKKSRDYRTIFIVNESNFMKKGGNWLNSSKNKFERVNTASGYNTVETFERLVQFCYSHNIEMKIYFSPIHARLLLTMSSVGLWDDLETLKTDVHRLNRRLAAKYDRDPYEIWDFATINSYSQEPIPPLGEKMQWYKESSHFLPALADKLQTVIAGVSNSSDIAEDFGVLLSMMNENQLSEYHSRKLDGMKRYVAGHPDYADKIFSKARELGTLQQEALLRLQF